MERQQDREWSEAQKIHISIDLIATAKDQLHFLEAVDANGYLYDGFILQRAVLRYKYCWLPLLSKHSESKSLEGPLVVPLDCEWIWHCHRLNPVRYIGDCKELFGRILDPGCDVVSSVQKACTKETEKIWKEMYPEEPYELDFGDHSGKAIKSEYTAIPSTDYDLISAVKRQSTFYYQVSRTYMKDDLFLEGAVQRYKGFLHLTRRKIEKKSKNFCVPTYDIDLIWHSHQLHPLSYSKDLLALLGKVLNHDDMVSEESDGDTETMDVGFKKTTQEWVEMFGSRYWKAGAMRRGTTDVQREKSAPQSPDILLVEILMEIMEVRNLANNRKDKLYLSISKKQPDLLFPGKRRVSICSEAEETQVVLLQCEPKGELLFELICDSSSNLSTECSCKSLGTTSIPLTNLLKSIPKLTVQKHLEFGLGTEPITLDVAISITPPSPDPYYALQNISTNTYANGWTEGAGCEGNFVGGGCKGNFEGAGCKGNFGGAGCKGNFEGARCKGNIGGAGCKGNFGRAGCKGNFENAGCKGNFEIAGCRGNFEGAGCKGNFGGAGCKGNFGGAGCTGNFEGAGCKGSFEGAGCKGSFEGAGCKGSFEGAGCKGSFEGAGCKGSFGGAGCKGSFGGAGCKGSFGGAGCKVNFEGASCKQG